MKKGRLLANAYLVLVFGFLYVPIAVLIAFSFNESKSRTVFTGFTFKWYQNLFHNDMVLKSLGVICYYTFTVKGFEENYEVFAPNARSLQESAEEKAWGRLAPEAEHDFLESLGGAPNKAVAVRQFCVAHDVPFLATDRSVLNLPGIGKSMSFALVGVDAKGRRILRFDHDNTRRHSPIIDRLGQIYIVENKSIASYLRQLQAMGEDAEEYATIWNYTEGKTESRFSLYEYPDFPFQITDRMSNQDIAG